MLRLTLARGLVTSVSVGTLLLATAGLGASSAPAETYPTAQARIANAEFLVGAVPPGRAAAVCQIDTGVNINPDTAQVVDRLSIVDGDIGDSSPAMHGTLTAMVMGAGANGFGMVGFWPAVRIVSVRANVSGQDTFTAPSYINAMKRCNNTAEVYGLKVVHFALASEAPLTADETAALDSLVHTAQAKGMNVVAAAGNSSGGPVLVPASLAGVLSIGGSDAAGHSCPTSAHGAVLMAPGCGLDAADPASGQPLSELSGTSGASAIVAVALAAIRSWRPDLDPAAAENVLKQTATPSAGGPMLDLAAAFHQLGLGGVVDAHQPTLPGTQPQNASPTAGAIKDLTPAKRLPRPLVRVRARRGSKGVLVIVRNRPRGVVTIVSVYRRAERRLRFVLTTSRRSSRVPLRVRAWDRLRVSFRDPSATLQRSRATIVIRPRFAQIKRG